MPNLITIAYNRMLDVLFPPVCVSCRAPIARQHDFVCSACFDKITLNISLLCPVCGARRATDIPCHHSPFTLAAACAYHEPIPSLIHHYKYAGLEKLRTVLAALLIVHARTTLSHISSYVVTYIPLHPRKERKRGFNQSRELARAIADYFHIPFVCLLARTRFTESQTKQKRYADRFKNVRECFVCLDENAARGRHILLVDDVCTSGATLWEASRALRIAHPRRIIALTIAKAE